MKRTAMVGLLCALCALCGCTAKYTQGISKTVCEIWINSMPQGSLLFLNGHFVGRTPYKYTGINDGDSSAHFVARDLSEIIGRKRGFDDEVESITVANCYNKLRIENEGVTEQVKHYTGGITLYLDTKEGFPEREYGNVSISAVPEDPDAEIYINGSLIGNGKTALLKLPAGSYILKVIKPGYKIYFRIISVLADNDVTINALLQKESGEAVGEGLFPATQAIELSPSGKEAEIEEDYVPGTVESSE
ncbi:MAG: PEGA domain-containing protein [Candidatus Aureabacteria bacterium]|nr:PEGA domain-containing protein [Candidatus Auribacterota bacterium]